MDLFHLINYLEKGETNVLFLGQLKREVAEYADSRIKQKSSSSIYGNFDENQRISSLHLIFILDKYLTGVFGEWEVEYILNFLELSVENIDEKANEVIFSFSSPDINFPITRENALNAKNYLEGRNLNLRLEPSKQDVLLYYRSILN